MTYGLHQRGIDVLEVEELVEQLRDESSIGLKHLSRHKTEIRNQYLVISESSLIIASTLWFRNTCFFFSAATGAMNVNLIE